MMIVIVGIVGWLFYLLAKFKALETLVKQLTQEQLRLQQQISQLRKGSNAPTSDEALNKPTEEAEKKTTAQIAAARRPRADVINESQAEPMPTASNNAAKATTLDPLQEAQPRLQPQLQPRPQQQTATTAKPQSTRPPLPPQQPNIADKAVEAVRRFFTEGNPIVRIGMVVMFFGVSFLVKYASGQGLFPIEFRLTGVVLVASALLVFGWKTRARAGGYGLVLQGGGIAVIYLTLFAAAKLYGLIPLGIAFGLLFCVVMLGVALALLQNAQVLAILATAGGFLAPILTSSGDGSHIGLFSFYLILNLGILAIALYKAWRLLNWVGFMFTFVITVAWGVLKYEPALYASTQPFLIAFFALYLTVSILFSFKQSTNLKGLVDGSLVFGLPLVAFGLQTTLLKHTEHGLAISAITLAALYIALAYGLSRRYLHSHRVLIELFLALGVSFATLAVPLALDASWTSVTWALEATGLVWVGLRQARIRPRIVGYLLHGAAAFSLVAIHGLDTGSTPLITGDFLALALLALTSFTIGYLIHIYRSQLLNAEVQLSPVAIAVGTLWWFVAGISELGGHLAGEQQFAAILLFAACTAIAFMQLSKKLDWAQLNNTVFALLPFVAMASASYFVLDKNNNHPMHGFGLIAIGLLLATQYRFLFNKERAQENKTGENLLLNGWHVLCAWWIFSLIFWEISWQQRHFNLQGTASLMIWFAAVVVPVIALIGAGQQRCWPFISFKSEYKNWVPAPLFLLAGLWFFSVCHKTSGTQDLYLPILNPLDLAQFAIILIFAYAAKRQFLDALSFISPAARASLLGIMLFVWVNVVTLRAMSHYEQIAYDFSSLWHSMQVQMALSIVWTACALLVMNIARRMQSRELWMTGAGLLGLVVLKLATKDLSGSGTLAGIISFMVVGALMLLIGYLSPIPVKRNEQNKSEDQGESHE
ncbi:MAG TPA: DUF2339 domain-containing protein [Cellvibrionaceae bacterium]